MQLLSKRVSKWLAALLAACIVCATFTVSYAAEAPQDAEAETVALDTEATLDAEEALNGWRTEGNHRLYYVDNVPLKYAQVIDGKAYYFNGDGQLLTGFLTFHKTGKTHYYGADGTMVIGWKKISGQWYYFQNDGTMARYSCTIDGNNYYFYGTGAMHTGWLKYQNGTWHYYDTGGAEATGWRYIKGHWYYLRANGVMACYENTIDGATYYFYGTGEMHTGWLRYGDGTWRYFNGSGAMVKSDWVSYRYYVNGSGVWVPDRAMPINIALGVSRSGVLAWLTSHENDSYYLTTPYAGRKAYGSSSSIYGWNPVGCIRPNGRYASANPGLNCAGFVADVFAYSGAGWSGVETVGTASRTYISATAWYNYVMNHHLQYYWFYTVDEALRSGRLHKGDVIYFLPKSSRADAYGNPSDAHMGFFWGNTSGENRLWHSSWDSASGVPGAGTLKNGNQISVLSPFCESYVYVFPLE